jgi:diguanylate cyclase (GGDEF)-like protein/PAS domain S-box-containing protein
LLREMLEIFATQAGLAIERAGLDERLRDEHARLLASEAAFRFSFSASAGAMATIRLRADDLGRFEQLNSAFCRAVGHRVEDLIGMRWPDLVVPAQRSGVEADLVHFATARQGPERSERQLLRRDGSAMWVGLTTTVIAPDTAVAPFLLVHLEDITERKQREDALAREAQVDPLTGLANRRVLLKYLRAVLAEDGGPGGTGVVLYGDLDRFKRINDRYGHAAGDMVIREAADRLRALVRPADVVARLGGDEFVIVAVDLDAVGANQMVQRIQAAFTCPLVTVAEVVTISVGQVHFDATTRDAREVLDVADRAMYLNKADPIRSIGWPDGTSPPFVWAPPGQARDPA